MKKILPLCLLFLNMGFSYCQNQDPKIDNYNPQNFYLPAYNPPAGNLYRSANGSPGPMYWQNSADYLIRATLNEKDTTITGDVTISYTNNSPDKLEYLWLQLDQNLFSKTSRGLATTAVDGDRFDAKGFEGGYQINNVLVRYDEKTNPAEYIISDTRMQVRLQNAMKPKGDKIIITINYSFEIPEHGADRLGRLNTKNGIIYEIAQWYPRMCVYDDQQGWNVLPYLGLGEFYCEYGNYEYYITAPAEMIVYGSGDLQNPEEVLTSEEIKRLAQAANSDETVTIISAEEIGKKEMRPKSKGNLTWHFSMKNTRDVAWAASKALIWDAAKINLPSGRTALAMSAYPPECMGEMAWTRGTEYLKASIEIYSKDYFEYPWNNAVSIAGIVTGMEYPGMIFNDYREKSASLWFLISHEIGHNWYPMIVGSNERRFMWLDEGLNSFINYRATEKFNNGEYANHPALYSASCFAYYSKAEIKNQFDPLMLLPDAMGINKFFIYYGKTSYGLNMLRNVVLGKDRFDYAFRKYTEAWAYKHPTPYDFFNSMNNGAGEDLNWFWKEWFFTTWKLDQAVSNVAYVDENPEKGALITIENQGKLIMPVHVKIVQQNGKEGSLKLPVEIWQRGGSWTFKYESTSKLIQVVLDPENDLPDINPGNNTWKQ